MRLVTPLALTQLKQQALQYATTHDVAILLDNNFANTALGIGDIEFAAAFGVKDYIELNSDCFDALKNFKQKHSNHYIFTQLSYDLKNELEHLHSNHPNHIGFARLITFVAQEVLVVNKKGEVILGDELVNQLAHQPKFLPQPNLANVCMQAKVNKEQYLFDVERIKQHIIEGDVYELNYCTEFFAQHVTIHAYSIYDKLMQKSPVPFAAFFKWFDRYLMCASPERFICKQADKIFSQPIKGTARRGATTQEDEQLKHQLLNSEKERAENLMIVDLVRNDLAITAQTGTVNVEELFSIYSFPQVHQMISTVSSLPKTTDDIEVIKKAFPMGSMTGAPKIMAMKLIERYEQTQRGLYSGSVGYFAPNGDFDFNVVIRSLQYNAATGYLSYEVGGAITYDSVAEHEYDECLLKAKAMMDVLSEQ